MKQFWLIIGTMSANDAIVSVQAKAGNKKKKKRERLIENKAETAEPIIFYSLHK